MIDNKKYNIFFNLYNKTSKNNEKVGLEKFIEMMIALRQQIILRKKFNNSKLQKGKKMTIYEKTNKIFLLEKERQELERLLRNTRAYFCVAVGEYNCCNVIGNPYYLDKGSKFEIIIKNVLAEELDRVTTELEGYLR